MATGVFSPIFTWSKACGEPRATLVPLYQVPQLAEAACGRLCRVADAVRSAKVLPNGGKRKSDFDVLQGLTASIFASLMTTEESSQRVGRGAFSTHTSGFNGGIGAL